MPLFLSHRVVLNAWINFIWLIATQRLLEELRQHQILLVFGRDWWLVFIRERIYVVTSTVGERPNNNLLGILERKETAQNTVTELPVEPSTLCLQCCARCLDLGLVMVSANIV